MISCDRLYASSEHPQLTQLTHVFPTVVGRVHPMSASLGPSHKLPVCPQTKRKITPKPSKIQGIAASWDAQEPGNLSGCCLAYDGQKDVGEQRAKDVRFILGKFRNGFVRRLETSFLKWLQTSKRSI